MDSLSTIKNNSPAFRHLDDEDIEQLLKVSSTLQVKVGDRVIKQGDPITTVYLVLEGRVNSVFKAAGQNDILLDQESAGCLLARGELQTESNYRCDLIAESDCKLLAIPYASFMQILVLKDGVAAELIDLAKPKTFRLLVAQYLTNLFKSDELIAYDEDVSDLAKQEWLEFEQQVLDELLDSVEWIHLNRGEYLFHHGDEADGAYILASGRLSITLQSDDDEIELDHVGHGEIIGEIALVADEKRSANVVAIRNCELIKISANRFRSISRRYPRLMMNIYKIISERFIKSRSSKKFRINKSNLTAFLPGKSPHLYSFVDSLFEQLQQLGSCELLNSRRVAERLQTPGIAYVEKDDHAYTGLMHWLNNLELNSDYLMYQADKKWNQWSWKCLTQADEIIIVVDTDEDVDLQELCSHMRETRQQWTLLLLHPEKLERPRNTAEWMDKSGACNVLHVRKNNLGDISRAARILTGNAFGLVLGGGGARGFAHIGVLRALKELDIPVDMIGGTSIAAPIAALVAQGHQPDEIKQMVKRLFKRLIDWTLPLTSMIRANRISKTIIQNTGDWDIEDFWIPYFCMSTNLTRATPIVHRRGNSAKAIRASLSIPGIMPPVPMDGDLLVDGGVLNNLPIDVMRQLNPGGKIIAIDVAPPTGTRAKQDYGLELSGWRLLCRSANPFSKKISAPAIGAVIMQSFILGSSIVREENLKQGTADYYQNIHITRVGLLEFKKVDYAEKLGYEASIKPLREWQ